MLFLNESFFVIRSFLYVGQESKLWKNPFTGERHGTACVMIIIMYMYMCGLFNLSSIGRACDP